MATLVVPDEVLRQAGLSEREALLEFACRLFDAGRLSLWSAAQLAGLDRNGMEDALLDPDLPSDRRGPGTGPGYSGPSGGLRHLADPSVEPSGPS